MNLLEWRTYKEVKKFHAILDKQNKEILANKTFLRTQDKELWLAGIKYWYMKQWDKREAKMKVEMAKMDAIHPKKPTQEVAPHLVEKAMRMLKEG